MLTNFVLKQHKGIVWFQIYLLLFCSGYMSPEYAMLGQFSMKSDVFSFGVIILEIISGKRNVDGNGKDLDDLLSHVSILVLDSKRNISNRLFNIF